MSSSVKVPRAFKFLWDTTADDGGPVRYRAVHGGRGSAKSHSFAGALLLKASETPLRVICAREIQKSIKDSKYLRAMATLLENDLPASRVMEATKGPLVIRMEE